MPTTANSRPVPEDTDPLADVALWIRDLAEAIPAMAAATEFLAGPVSTKDISFPAGRFTVAPVVQCTAIAGSNVALSISVGNVTTSGFRAYIYGVGGTWTSGAASIGWLAVEIH